VSGSGLLEGRVALVVGGASGLGEAISHRFAREGATVVVGDIDGKAAQSVADAVVAAGGNAVAVEADVTKRAEVEAMVDEAARLGPLRVLVCSAAIETSGTVVECTNEDWDRVLGTNLKGPFLSMKYALPVMASNGGGSVILMGSVVGIMAAPGLAAYAASKGALVNLGKQAAIEHAPDQVRVNTVAPSATTSGLFMRFSDQTDDPDGLRERVARGTPMRRLGTADDVCDLVTFLASDASSYLSGVVIPLDGGMAARRP